MNACDVMGSRACGEKPGKELKEDDPTKYCLASKVYYECIHKKYRGCEDKEKYENAMESMLKGIKRRVSELQTFCDSKIEDFTVNIVWEEKKPVPDQDSVRGNHQTVVNNPTNVGVGSSVSTGQKNDYCSISAVNQFCEPMRVVRFVNNWNSLIKRQWCNQGQVFYRCIKSRVETCNDHDIRKHFENIEHYLQSQINANCPGGTEGCQKSNDVRCKIGTFQSNRTTSTSYSLSNIILILFLVLTYFYEV
ncbi:unnamed protein product [Didymodactylos carnosus]|uniref:Uncharacterized protein n=1 Tax=Didymodactylos carnosus TaxID=1234261 RepID=A0A814ZZD3_9BILA|nr:unnamed protein product [Didymodactylos carnosus]CAF1250535.1 unnamed protein product [Didymodactylos carnosus]CAF3646992.1 unnamed protein product [Didymodactylos carnosus]CAF4019491.1 unnamed protein product [Didymodactylos carnosus]